MKKIDGNIWYEERAGRMSVGFTRQCLDEKLQECFHILPADSYSVKARGPLMVLETNDGLESVRSPVAGRVLFFNDKARNFPDRLTEEDVIVEIEMPKPEVKKVASKKSPTTKVVTGGNNQAVFPIPWAPLGDERDPDGWLIDDLA